MQQVARLNNKSPVAA